MIQIDSLTLEVSPDQQPVLQEISWSVTAGDRWVLFGPNGSGKTKLLEVITGYRRPTTGTVTRFGMPAGGHDIREIRKSIGYLSSPLREKIFPHERALDCVVSGFFATAGLYDEPKSDHIAYAETMLDRAGLLHRKNDFFSHFSDGEKQKLLLARAMAGDPLLLILDEPCAGLDIAAREELLAALELFFPPGCSTALIFVTHHVEEITPLFSCLHILDGGRTYYTGTVAQGICTDHLSELFDMDITVSRQNGRYFVMLASGGRVT